MAVLFEEYAGMMVHAFWHPHIMPREGMLSRAGVRIYTSTRQSNTSGYLHMAVHDVPGMLPSNVFGPHSGGIYRGTLRDVLPPPPNFALPVDPAQYLVTRLGGINFHRAYAGYSLHYRDISGVYHAVDFYRQDPGMVGTGVYHHYVLTDITDPVQWYLSRMVRMEGQVRMDDSPVRRMQYPSSM